jgi:hypothetical protein
LPAALVERVGPMKAGQGPSWFEHWVQTENGEKRSQFQEEESVRRNAWPVSLMVLYLAPWASNVEAPVARRAF